MSTAHVTTDPLTTVMKAAGRAGIPVLLWGDPGTGKSSLIEALAYSEGLPLETVIASLREPSDFAGLPVVTDGGVRMVAPDWASRLAASEDGGVLFLDELSTAPPAVQAALLRVVLDRVVGDLALPRNVRVIAAANPPERAADGWDLPAPTANRFLHIDHEPGTGEWIDGMIAGFATPTPGVVAEPSTQGTAIACAEVAEFIRANPLLLHRPPTTDAAAGRAWASRRTWHMAAKVIALLDPNDTEAVLLAVKGLVGEGAAVEFLAWRKTSDLPHPADVVDDPSTVAWGSLDPSRAWVVLSSVVAHCVAQGTKTAWTAAWKPLKHAADEGLADVAAVHLRTLMHARPNGASIPAAAKSLSSVASAAGLV